MACIRGLRAGAGGAGDGRREVTPFARFLKRTAERLFGTFEEGPRPPERLRQMVVEFLNAHPKLTRRQVGEFGAQLAENCYRAGYARGWESTVRDPAAPWRTLPPELVADLHDPDWRWRPALGDELENPEDYVEEDVVTAPIDVTRHSGNRPAEE
jgi:hypothetical protein